MVKSFSLLASALFVFLSADRLCAGPVELRCEYLHQPLGIDVSAPRFSWQSDSSERNWAQSAYELLVASKPELLAEGTADVWDSGRVRSDSSVGIVYAGPRLKPQSPIFLDCEGLGFNGRLVRLRPGDLVGNRFVCRGLVGSEVDFVAGPGGGRTLASVRWIWIPKSRVNGTVPETEAVFQRTFKLSTRPLRATIFLTARSNFRLKVNGNEVASKNGWVSFDRQEIGYLLHSGANLVEVTVKTHEPKPWDPDRAEKIGKPPLLAGLLKVELPDGDAHGHRKNWDVRTTKDPTFSPASVATESEAKRFGALPEVLPEPAAMLRREFDLTR